LIFWRQAFGEASGEVGDFEFDIDTTAERRRRASLEAAARCIMVEKDVVRDD
jgi:hypothetical protein